MCSFASVLSEKSENSSVIEHHLAKVGVAGLNPVFRSYIFKMPNHKSHSP